MATRDRVRIDELIQKVLETDSFQNLNEEFVFEYFTDSKGGLQRVPDDCYDLVFSWTVLEHVKKMNAQATVEEMYRILRPGGYAIHGIDLGDHLSYYDRSSHLKHYLKYSDKTWERWFQNDVQYFNRIQRPEWLDLFEGAGFETVEKISAFVELDGVHVAKSFSHLMARDLECRTLRLVSRKPVADKTGTRNASCRQGSGNNSTWQ